MLSTTDAIRQFATACLMATDKPYDRLPHRLLHSAYCQWQKELPKERPAMTTIALNLAVEVYSKPPEKVPTGNVWVGWQVREDS